MKSLSVQLGVILIGILFLGSGSINLDVTKAQSLSALQETCEKSAYKYFVDSGYVKSEIDEEGRVLQHSYRSHYNKRLDKCYMLLTSLRYMKKASKEVVASMTLTDTSEGKVYGEFAQYRSGVTRCYVNDLFCKSEAEFKSLIKNYMED